MSWVIGFLNFYRCYFIFIFLNVCVGTGSYVRELEEQGIETK